MACKLNLKKRRTNCLCGIFLYVAFEFITYILFAVSKLFRTFAPSFTQNGRHIKEACTLYFLPVNLDNSHFLGNFVLNCAKKERFPLSFDCIML